MKNVDFEEKRCFPGNLALSEMQNRLFLFNELSDFILAAENIEGVFRTPKTFKNLHTPKFCALSFATIHFIVGHLRSSQNRHCWKNIFCVGSHFFHHFPQRPWKLTSPKILRRTASRASWHARSWWWVWNHHQKKIRVPTNLGVQPCQLSRL